MDFSTPLKNARHETFVLGLLEGKSDTKAYEDAGYKTDRHHAARLATKGHIQGRLAFLQAEAAKEAVIDAAWVTKRLVENVERAMQAIEVTDAEGKRTGEYSERAFDAALAGTASPLRQSWNFRW